MATAREDLIRATIRRMRERGVAGTGIADLLEDSGRSRRTVYLNFPGGKAELVDAATRAAGNRMTRLIETAIERTATSVELLGQLAAASRGLLESSAYRSGCPIVAAALGRSEAPDAADSAGRTFEQWIAGLAAELEQDGHEPDAARRLATTIVAALEGAVVIGSATGSSGAVDDVERTLATLLADQPGETAATAI